MGSKIFKKMLLVGIVGMLLVGMMPSVSADYDSLKVIVTVEDKAYNVGDTVNITVHVFDKGEYVSADDVNVTIGYYPPIYVLVTEISTYGVYEGTYTIQPSDTYVTITAMVTKGADSDESTTWIGLDSDLDLDVDVELDDLTYSSVSPGDDVEITITVKENGVNVNADNFTLNVGSDEINYTNSETGVYKGTYTVSSDLTESKTFSIYAEASKDSKTGSGYGAFSVNFYSVWYHNVSVTDTSSSFEIYVADLDGNTVSTASVSFNYDDDANSSTPNMNKAGTTNSNGKAQFSISYSNVDSLWISGTVNASGNTQHFSGSVSVKPYGFTPDEEGLSIINTDTVDWSTYKPGTTITRHYTAYVSNAAAPSKEIYYYAVMEGEYWMYNSVIKHGVVITDGNGEFSLSLNLPSNCESVGIHFEAAISQTEATVYYEDADSDGMVYEEGWDYFHTSGESCDLSDSAVSISTGVLTVGGNTQVTVSASGATSEDTLGVSWVIGEGDVFSLTYPNWACWGGGYDTVPLTKSGDTYTGSIKIPSFMPADAKYTIFAYWYDKDTETTHINHVTLSPGESGSTDGTDGTTDDGATDDGTTGDTTTNGDGGKDEGGGGFIPGFETITIISGIGICLILIKRKRK